MKYMVVHRFHGGVTSDQATDVWKFIEQESDIKPYRCFVNLTEGTAVSILEAPSREFLADWFRKWQWPYESISLVEMEGEKGKLTDSLVGVEVGAAR